MPLKCLDALEPQFVERITDRSTLTKGRVPGSALNAPEPSHALTKRWLSPAVSGHHTSEPHAANFSLGLSPALDASRTSMSKLN
jgi:hypothetical protein